MALMAALLVFGTVQAQVSKWVDEKGTVHYGDAIPDKYRDSAKAVALRNDAQSPAEAMEAQTRLQSYTESPKAPKSASEPAAPAIDDSLPPQVRVYDSSCDGQWQQYYDALDCFAPYKNTNGSMKPEAASRCPIIKAPNCIARNVKPRL
jgi:hypothetical protein